MFRSQQASGPHSEFAEDEAKMVAGLGEMGEPVVLQGREAQLGENIMKTEAFNLIVSDKISYTREVPDTRDMRCQAVQYDATLPTTSVIIIFTNEAWSPLIRTIWSVLNRSPEDLVKEIILVDDFSDKSHLKGKLERYIHRFLPSKVKLMRLAKREGLIRARLAGARAATGDVILYLDSHCECNTGWLEPLLARIKENPLAFVVPIIDVIDDKTLEYYHGNGNYFQVGGFTWSGHFTWIDISQSELARRGSPIGATRSPTMAGGKNCSLSLSLSLFSQLILPRAVRCGSQDVLGSRELRRGNGRLGWGKPRDVLQDLAVRRSPGDNPLQQSRPHLQVLPPLQLPREQGHPRHQHRPDGGGVDGGLQEALLHEPTRPSQRGNW